MQQKDPSSSNMSGLDKSLVQQESRKCVRNNQTIARKDKNMETAQQADRIASSIVGQSSSSATSSSESDDDFQPPSTPATLCQFRPNKSKWSMFTVAASLYRVKISDRGAMPWLLLVQWHRHLAMTWKKEMTLSWNTIHRARIATSKALITTE